MPRQAPPEAARGRNSREAPCRSRLSWHYALIERIDERPLDRHVNPDGIAQHGGDRSANIKPRAGCSHDIEQGVAAAVLDVFHLRRNGVEAAGPLADEDLFRANRNRRPRAIERLLAYAHEAHV